MANVACSGCNIIKSNVHIPNITVSDSNDNDIPITPPEKSDGTDVSQPMLILPYISAARHFSRKH